MDNMVCRVTFLDHGKVSDPIEVPPWSVISWFDDGHERSVMIGGSKTITWGGIYYVNGEKRQPPVFRERECNYGESVWVNVDPEKPGGVLVPAWLLIPIVILMYTFLALWLWEVLDI